MVNGSAAVDAPSSLDSSLDKLFPQGLRVAHDSDHAESEAVRSIGMLRYVVFGYSRKAGFLGKPGMTLVWGGCFLSGGQQTEGGGFSHRSPPGDRPQKTMSGAFKHRHNTRPSTPPQPPEVAFTAFSPDTGDAVNRRLKPPEIVFSLAADDRERWLKVLL